MAWYPGATKMELQPESDQQPAITPDQLIFHSIAAPWTPKRIFEYWRDSTNLESHFGQGYDGKLAQFVGTQTRADANYLANRRANGHGAISVETASNLQHTDPWTDAQVQELIDLGVWAHKTHGIPLRICRTWDDPGFGYHAMFTGKWSPSGTACPGAARIRQFREVVFPGIVARATNTEEEDMTPEQAAQLTNIENKVTSIGSKLGTIHEDLKAAAAKIGALDTTGLTAQQVQSISKAVLDGLAARLAS